ncbi:MULTISPECIES: antitoxin [Nocardioides]|uniref:Antitoxin n=1 Tax=Nocardioides kribbensis TaxID=305517 RepID=A0ABV1NWW8_9ACTN|nr:MULTISPECIES: antitoxin [Nocardioides]KQP62679.1 hypothetical protein ASF47_19695 [Nocardioides sp. Leaf285]KQQ42097.1 hypothetical protein ASF50_14720 [Nocardioides sp. Leaf307]MCM3514728.1 antitoxin [Nocardioides sp. P86]
MGLFDKARLDKVKRQVSDAVDKHGDKISGGIDKAAAAADKRTGGKHSDKIAKGVAKAKDGLDKLDGKNDDFRDGPAGPAGPTGPTGPAGGPR